MELIKITGSKSWTNGSGNKDSAKFGIFLCPVCKKEVEKSLSHGKRANSCGDNSCRKEMFRPNKSNVGNKRSFRISDIQYYSAIKERYRQICLEYTVCNEWKIFKNFVDDMHEQYIDARKISDKLYFIVHDENKIVDKNNCEFKPAIKYQEYPNSDCKNKKYIYIVKADIYTKIGITNNIANRMCSIQTCNPFVVELIFALEIKDALATEQKIHLSLNEYNVLGEWFKLEHKQISDIISSLLLLKDEQSKAKLA